MNDDEIMPYQLGEICEHETLKRKCDICWSNWQHSRMEEAIRVFAEEVKAWRKCCFANDNKLYFENDEIRLAAQNTNNNYIASEALKDKSDERTDRQSISY